ncbi:hypothetical protein [Undibacterium rugosum]|nr:hypothetical protein [Undibacterium rugosum]
MSLDYFPPGAHPGRDNEVTSTTLLHERTQDFHSQKATIEDRE